LFNLNGKTGIKVFKKVIGILFGVPLAVCAVYLSLGVYHAGIGLHELLSENANLKQAITNITDDGKIGLAKIIKQETIDGKLYSTIRFVETARDDELKRIIEKEYTIEGDVIHFDAIIIKFGNQMVLDGKEKSMYLWRRIYSETMAPADGLAIETEGAEPIRYADILAKLPTEYREMFWTNIWKLANDPQMLRDYDIEAVYGSDTYFQLRPGLIYSFVITPTGQIYPEVTPEI
jgi:hypothetical protein